MRERGGSSPSRRTKVKDRKVFFNTIRDLNPKGPERKRETSVEFRVATGLRRMGHEPKSGRCEASV